MPFIALALLVLPQTVPQPTPTDVAKPPKEKKACRSERATGSVMTKRICHTDAEWATIDQANSAASSEVVRRNQLSGAPR